MHKNGTVRYKLHTLLLLYYYYYDIYCNHIFHTLFLLFAVPTKIFLLGKCEDKGDGLAGWYTAVTVGDVM